LILKLKYSIDTSAILDGWVRYYPPDVFPNLWQNLDELINIGELRATEEVLSELGKIDDKVYNWAKDRSQLFVPIDKGIQQVVSEISQNYKGLVDAGSHRSYADPFVIALALINKSCVITGEHLTSNIEKPKIPDVCRGLGIRYVNLLGLIREQGWVFKKSMNR